MLVVLLAVLSELTKVQQRGCLFPTGGCLQPLPDGFLSPSPPPHPPGPAQKRVGIMNVSPQGSLLAWPVSLPQPFACLSGALSDSGHQLLRCLLALTDALKNALLGVLLPFHPCLSLQPSHPFLSLLPAIISPCISFYLSIPLSQKASVLTQKEQVCLQFPLKR